MTLAHDAPYARSIETYSGYRLGLGGGDISKTQISIVDIAHGLSRIAFDLQGAAFPHSVAAIAAEIGDDCLAAALREPDPLARREGLIGAALAILAPAAAGYGVATLMDCLCYPRRVVLEVNSAVGAAFGLGARFDDPTRLAPWLDYVARRRSPRHRYGCEQAREDYLVAFNCIRAEAREAGFMIGAGNG